MTVQDIQSFVAGDWLAPDSAARDIRDAVTGDVIARAGRAQVDQGAGFVSARAQAGSL